MKLEIRYSHGRYWHAYATVGGIQLEGIAKDSNDAKVRLLEDIRKTIEGNEVYHEEVEV